MGIGAKKAKKAKEPATVVPNANVNPSEAQTEAAQTNPVDKKAAKKKATDDLINNTLGKVLNVIPGIITKAAHGFSFLVGIIKNDTAAFKIQKTTGDELKKELDKVQNESKEYLKSSEDDEKMRIEGDKNKKK